MDKVIFTDESQVVLDGNQRIYIRRRRDEAESPDCMCPPAQQKVAVMIWGCITWYGAVGRQLRNGHFFRSCKHLSIYAISIIFFKRLVFLIDSYLCYKISNILS